MRGITSVTFAHGRPWLRREASEMMSARCLFSSQSSLLSPDVKGSDNI